MRRELEASSGAVASAAGGAGQYVGGGGAVSDPITDVNAHAVIRLDRRSQNESAQVLYLRKINPYLALSLVMPEDAYKNLCTLRPSLSLRSSLTSCHIYCTVSLSYSFRYEHMVILYNGYTKAMCTVRVIQYTLLM